MALPGQRSAMPLGARVSQNDTHAQPKNAAPMKTSFNEEFKNSALSETFTLNPLRGPRPLAPHEGHFEFEPHLVCGDYQE